MAGRRKPRAVAEPSRAEQAFAAAVGREDGAAPVVTLSNGIRLRMHAVTPDAVRVVIQRLKRPKPPTVYIEEKGRHEENPSDPDYLAALEEHAELVQETGMNVLLALGTTVEEVPVGLEGPEDEGWRETVERLSYFGVEADLDDPRGRYLAWLRYYALATDKDLMAVLVNPMLRAGLSEEEVNVAVESFRRGA